MVPCRHACHRTGLHRISIWLWIGFVDCNASTIGTLTFGYRIHHGYIGLLLIPLGIALDEGRYRVGWLCFVIGVALFLSDAIHHFLVLWPLTGSPQFDFVYPKSR